MICLVHSVDVLFNSFVQVSQKERPPMHEYIRKLLYKDLSKTTTEKVNHNIVLYISRYISYTVHF